VMRLAAASHLPSSPPSVCLMKHFSLITIYGPGGFFRGAGGGKDCKHAALLSAERKKPEAAAAPPHRSGRRRSSCSLSETQTSSCRLSCAGRRLESSTASCSPSFTVFMLSYANCRVSFLKEGRSSSSSVNEPLWLGTGNRK